MTPPAMAPAWDVPPVELWFGVPVDVLLCVVLVDVLVLVLVLVLILELAVSVPLVVATTDGTTYVVAILAIGLATTVCVVGSLQVTFPEASAPQQNHSFVFVLKVISNTGRFAQPKLQLGSASEESVQPPT